MKGEGLALLMALMLGGCAGNGFSQGAPRPLAPAAAAPSAGAMTSQNEATLYLNVIDGLVKQQRCNAALSFLDGYALKQASLPSRYWLLRGNALLGIGRYAEAGSAFARLNPTPLASEGWNGQGRVAATMRDWPAASADFRRAALTDPSNADVLNNLAYAELHVGNPAAAAATLRQALELAPGSDLIRNNLIIALTLSGDRPGADRILNGIEDGARREKTRSVLNDAIRTNTLTADGKS